MSLPTLGQIFSNKQAQPDNAENTLQTHDEPAVTRTEVALFLAEKVVKAQQALARTLGGPALYIVENRFDTFEFELAYGLAERLGYVSLYQALKASEGAEELPGEGFVATLAQVSALVEQGHDVYDQAVNILNQGKNLMLVCRSADQVPSLLASLSGGTVKLPRFDQASVGEACRRFYDLDALPEPTGDAGWTRHVLPEDFLINSSIPGNPLRAIRESVLRRLRPYTCDDAKALEQLHAIGAARDWGMNWAADVRELLSGESDLRWDDVERGALLVGDQGMGKTRFARALAKATGMHLLEASLGAALATPPERGGPAAYLASVNLEAQNLSPCLILMEAEGVPVVGLESLFDSFDPENPVFILVAALPGVDGAPPVDRSLLRHGRIEGILEIPMPTASVLKEVFADLLRSVDCRLDDKDLDALSKMAQGNIATLADAEKTVRQAHRAARRKSRPLTLDDLTERIFNTPGASRRQRSSTQIEDTAYHEAGHAVMSLLMANEGRDLTYLTVVPRDYANGFAARAFDESSGSITRESQLEEIRMALGGRAAEEIKKGRENIGAGCSQDIRVATNIATMMLTRWAFGTKYPLVSRASTVESDPELRQEVGELLDEQYRKTLELLSANWKLVERLATAVMQAEELTGNEVRDIYAKYRSDSLAA